MDIFLAVLLLVIGLVLIIKGGDWFVDSSVQIAKRSGIPELVIGATIVSIGTTVPELLVSTIATIQGRLAGNEQVLHDMTAIAINNAVGSMLCNIGLILSIVLIFSVLKTESRGFVEKSLYILGVSILLIIFAVTDKTIVLWEGILLLLLFVGFIISNLFDAKRQQKLDAQLTPELQEMAVKEALKPVWWVIVFFILGVAGIGGGAYLLVNCGQFLAEKMNIPSAIIGATIIAIGTSLPELVTAITSLRKKSTDLSLGNVIGANIINATLVLGLISTISGQGLVIDTATYNLSMWFMLAITSALVIPCLFRKKTSKIQGVVIFVLYLAYLITNITLVALNSPVVM